MSNQSKKKRELNITIENLPSPFSTFNPQRKQTIEIVETVNTLNESGLSVTASGCVWMIAMNQRGPSDVLHDSMLSSPSAATGTGGGKSPDAGVADAVADSPSSASGAAVDRSSPSIRARYLATWSSS